MSNFRELIPVLKSLITGEPSSSSSVRQSVENVLNDAAVSLQTDSQRDGENITDEDIRDTTIEELLTAGEMLRNRELRAHIRPERIPSIEMDCFLDRNGFRLIVAEVSPDQWSMILHRIGGHIDNFNIEVPENPYVRQSTVLNRPLVRKFNSLIAA